MEDLDRAIEMSRQSVVSAPNNDPDRAVYLSNLGITLQRRLERTGSITDLDDAKIAFNATQDSSGTSSQFAWGRPLKDSEILLIPLFSHYSTYALTMKSQMFSALHIDTYDTDNESQKGTLKF